MPIYRVPYFGVLVTALGEHHARHCGIPTHDYEEKMATREVPITPKLQPILAEWRSLWPTLLKRDFERADFVLPAPTDINKHWARPRVDEGLRAACKTAGIEGVSTHSFRRSALTHASSAGVPTRTIQLLSGHSSLEQLQRYIDVSDQQKRQAANAFG